jgi:prephenate dehydratase
VHHVPAGIVVQFNPVHQVVNTGPIHRFVQFGFLESQPVPGAAAELAKGDDKTQGALASALAAKTYGLDLLAQNIEDHGHNTTRFLVMSPEPSPAAASSGPIKTTFVFRVRNLPAALYKAMGGFATNGVNMTKLESYMVDGAFTATQFYADIEGHPDDAPVSRALEELAYFTDKLEILGVYPADPEHFEGGGQR